jgi:hypothetical protein
MLLCVPCAYSQAVRRQAKPGDLLKLDILLIEGQGNQTSHAGCTCCCCNRAELTVLLVPFRVSCAFIPSKQMIGSSLLSSADEAQACLLQTLFLLCPGHT